MMLPINFTELKPEEQSAVFSSIQKDIPLPLASIEKDWWVVQTLRMVFQIDSAPQMVFKGGTSLRALLKIHFEKSPKIEAITRSINSIKF